MKLRKKLFKIQPVGVWVHVTICDDIKEQRDRMTKELGFPGPPDLSGAMGLHSYHYETLPGQHFVLLHHNAPLNVIAHEVLHVVEVVDGWYGIHSEEYRAYLQGYLTEEIYKFVNKPKNK